jgi:hypothetical protein
MPGYGKSTLRQRFEDLLQSARLGDDEELSKRVAYASLQLKIGQPVTDQLISIRTQLARSGGFRFFLFDWAFIRWFRLAHPDASIQQRHPNMFSAGGGAADDILSWLDEIGKDKAGGAVAEHAGAFMQDSITLIPGLNLLVKYGYKLGASAKGWWDKKAYRDQIAVLDRLTEEELLDRLAGLLAADLEAVLAETRRKHGAASATILIDGAEKFLTAHDHRGAMDRWVLDFRTNAPSAFLNLFSRTPDPAPGLGAATVRLLGFNDHDLGRLAGPHDVPEACLDVIERFACGVPLSTQVALSLFRDNAPTLRTSDEERSEALHKLLLTEGHARVLSHVARDLSGETVRDMVFLSALDHVADWRIDEYGDLVFGSGANVNMDSIINHGLVESIELDVGVYRSVPDYLQEAFLRSPRHERLRTDILQRLSSACFELALRRSAEEGEVDILIRGDMDRATSVWSYRWSKITFDHWERTMQSLLEADHVRQVWGWASRVLQRAAGETPGVLRLDDGDTEGKLRLCARAGSVVARAAARLGDHVEAVSHYRLVVDARRRLGDADFSTCFRAADLAIVAGDRESFEYFVIAGLEAVLTRVDRALAILDRPPPLSAVGAETYGHLLAMACDEADVAALQAARELALGPRWLQSHAALRGMHMRVGELLCISEPNYRDLRALHGALAQAREVLGQGARELGKLSPCIFAHEALSDMTRELVFLASRSLRLEVDQSDGDEEATDYSTIASGWKTLDDELRDRAVGHAAYELLEQCGDDMAAFGDRLLRALQIEADRGDFEKAAALCHSYEEALTQNDGCRMPGVSELILIKVYGYFAVALQRLGAEGRAVEGKLAFALRMMIDTADDDVPPSRTRDRVWQWFSEVVCQPIGFEPYIRENDAGPGYHYGLMPVDRARYHS